jgi:anaphase-promoting complex subunit 1
MRAFLSSDLVGQTYLCYLVPALGQLLCTRLEKANKEQKLIFGVVNNITAKDAAPLPVSHCSNDILGLDAI